MATGIDIKKKLAILEEGANITTDATSIDFVGSGVNSSSVGGNVTVNIPGGSGTTTYYLNESVTQTPYKEFSSIATGAIEQIVPLTVSAGATSVIAEYLTPTGVPGTTQIPTGLWQFFLHFNAGATGQNWIIKPEVYKRDLGGIETLLLTLDPVVVTNMSTTTTMYVSDAVFPFTTILTTDRILVRISMQNTTGVSQTVNFRTEGNQHYSVGLTTLNQVIPTGAVTSVTGTAPIVSSGGTTPAISIAQATAIADGYLSSSDFAVFSAKVGGSGTLNYVSKFTGTGTLGNSNIFDNGTNVGIGTATPAKLLDVNGDALINGLTVGRGTSGSANNAILGISAGAGTGTLNVYMGTNAGRFNGGSGCVGIGLSAGGYYGGSTLPLSSSSNCVFIGNQVIASANGVSNEIVIGSQTMGKGSNTVNIGNTSITNTYLNGAVTFNNAFTFPTTDGTANQVLKTNGSGVVTWGTAGSSSGIWGIANASGVYTYYATWALAVATATAGQVIELFADITESAVSYTLKNGVNINGNGHSVSFSVVDGFIATSSPTICQINNIVINQATASVSGLYINAGGSIIGGNATFNSNNATSNGVYGRVVTRIYGFNCNGYNAISASGFFSPNAIIDNVYVESLGGAVTAGTLSNSIIKTSAVGVTPVSECGIVNNCYIYSNGGNAVVSTGTSEVNNCTIISVTSRAVTGNGITFNNCWIKSSANNVAGNGKFNNCTLIASTTAINPYLGGGLFNNCTITANASAVFSAAGSPTIVNNCNVVCNYNNAAGYAFTDSACYVNNSVIQLANASATAFYGTSALTMYLANNSIKGTTNFKNVNVTNGQTNTADAQGNVILQ